MVAIRPGQGHVVVGRRHVVASWVRNEVCTKGLLCVYRERRVFVERSMVGARVRGR